MEKLASLDAAQSAIENAAQLRLRVEIGRLNETADQIQKSLIYHTSAQLGEFADRVAQIDQKWSGLVEQVNQYDSILNVLLPVKARYGPHMETLKERFNALNVKLIESLSIIKEPSKMILAELDEQINIKIQSASTIQATVIELVRTTPEPKRRPMPGTVYELSNTDTEVASKMMRALSPLMIDAATNYEETKKLNHTIATLRQTEDNEPERSPEQAYLLVKYVHAIWDLAASVGNKIESIKSSHVGSTQHTDCLADAKRICDEMDNAINWIETTDTIKVTRNIHPYRQALIDWCTIMEEMKLINGSALRTKEIMKLKSLLDLNHVEWEKLNEIKLGPGFSIFSIFGNFFLT